MTDPMIPGLDAAVEAAVNELRLIYNEGPGDLYDLVHDAITAAYPHLIAPAVKAAQYRVRKMVEPEGSAWSVERAGWRAHENFDNEADATAARDHLIAALLLTDPTEPPEAA